MILLIATILLIYTIGGPLLFIWRGFKIAPLVGAGFGLILSLLLVIQFSEPISFDWNWALSINFGLHLDLSASYLILLVSIISFLVHLFSLEYMKDDDAKPKYYALLGFFTSSMIGLLLAKDLISLFIFWELVGFASYLLIGFWYKKENVASSARMAFMINRIADVALLIGIALVYTEQDRLIIGELSELSFAASILIAIGAFGKSAQFPFSGWLVKAMVGPTSISALIHAATMVAAGVYLLFRMSPYLNEIALSIVALVGVATALYGALSALTQNDIKKLLAYSTISQLGYMIMGIGVGAATSSIVHLWTHAFFKAGLFLGAGAVIHYIQNEIEKYGEEIDAQDMRYMGGLAKQFPWLFRSFLICGLALAGLPFFSGFISKEGLLTAAFDWADRTNDWGYLVPDLAIVTVLITAFYVGRMIFLTFLGENRIKLFDGKSHESNYLTIPVFLLAVGSLWLFYSINPVSHSTWLHFIFGENSNVEGLDTFSTSFFAIVLSLGGIALSYFLFRPGTDWSRGYINSQDFGSKGGRLVYEGFYLTQFYQLGGVLVVKASRAAYWVDYHLIDGLINKIGIASVVLAKVTDIVDRLIVDGVVKFVAWFAKQLASVFSSIHTRQVQTQLIWLLIGLVITIIFLIVR